jgi:glycosyltransferase involved in cell wall biosynthesis
MRVLLISHTCQSRVEGQPKAEQLARLGVDLAVLTPRRFNHFGVWREAETPADPIFQLLVRDVSLPWLGPAQNYLHWYPSLPKILRDFKPDIIDLWEEPWSLVSAQACWLRNRLCPRAKIVSESEQNLVKDFPPPFELQQRYTLRNADFAVGRSSEVIEVLRTNGYTGPARVVGNAVDTDLFHPMDREACRNQIGISGFIAGYVGRIVERKGLMEMIEALQFCPPDVQMVFIGDGEYLPELEQRADELGKSARVHFLHGRAPAELPEVMNAFDVMVLPSRTVPSWKEQFGRVIIEAHACGVPVIGSDSGAIPEIVGGGGLIFRERDPQALAAAICKLRAAPVRQAQMGEIGRAQVQRHYTWKRVAEQMRDVYENVLASSVEPVFADSRVVEAL